MGFFADNLKKGTKTTYLNGFLEKKIIQKLLKIS